LGIVFLKLIDRMLGGIAAACLPAPASGAPGSLGPLREARRILVIRPGGIGDAVLLAPALLALRERFPAARLDVLAEARNAAAFALCPAVDRVLLYHRGGDLASALTGGYDLVIDSEQWHRLSAVVARLVRAPVSIGFASNDRKRLFSHQIAYSQDDYEALSFFNLLAPLGIRAPDGWAGAAGPGHPLDPGAATGTVPAAAAAPGTRVLPGPPFLTLPPAAVAAADALLAPLGGARFLALFPGASIPERRWGAQRYQAVARAVARGGLPVVVVGGRDDAPEAEAIVQGTGGLNLAGRTSLAETAAVLARSALLLSGDSGVLHLAVGLGVSTVSLFGPGIEAKWGPRGEGHRVLNKRCACSPCTRFGTTPPCPSGAHCLAELTVAEVVAAVEKLLGPGDLTNP
jgi:ADP-heptose:LPS heptosyltransferase